MAGLSNKRLVFIAEYMIDFNATQAAIRAGYSSKAADRMGPSLIGIPCIKEEINKRIARRGVSAEATVQRVVMELARIAFFDKRKLYRDDGSLKQPHEWDDDTAAVVG
jgi:phage terminase small subunit